MPAVVTPAIVIPTAADPAAVEQATEIAAAPQPVEMEDSTQAEKLPSPALTVIGQNRNLDESQFQSATPAPTANNEGIMEGPYAAIGLILLVVAFIAIWFLRRLLLKAK